VSSTQTTSFKKECWQGVHDLDNDTLKIALYSKLLDSTVTAYTPTDEVSGSGYLAGGAEIAGVVVSTDLDEAVVDADNTTVTGMGLSVRSGLIYNASKGNRSVAVIDFGADAGTVNNPTITWPTPTAGTALIHN
jgi:hypothetical protein